MMGACQDCWMWTAAGLRPIVIGEAHDSGGQIYRRQLAGFVDADRRLWHCPIREPGQPFTPLIRLARFTSGDVVVVLQGAEVSWNAVG
jgi:hypothetical protein